MSKFTRYLQAAIDAVYKMFYRGQGVTIVNKKVAELVNSGEETITSPSFIEYLINKHIRELEYTYLVEKLAFHELKLEESYHYLSKMDFINALEQAYKDKAISLQTYLKTQKIRDSASFEAFLNDHKDDNFNFIRSEEDSVPVNVNTLTEMLTLPWEELENLLERKPFGLTKEEFTYTALAYFKLTSPLRYQKQHPTKEMLLFYQFPERLKSNLENLEKQYDITAIQEEIQEKPNYLEEVEVNPDLWKKVLSQIPEDFNTLEKAYYIYYELCKIFTYNPDYFTWGETQMPKYIGFEHRINNLSSKTEVNNYVICFEIMAIYQKFIEHLGIKFDINDGYRRGASVKYKEHPELNMIIDNKFFIVADPTTGIIKGDLPRAKENRPLQGFKCKNNSEVVQDEFHRSIDKVHQYIFEHEKQTTSFFDVVNAYKELAEETFELSSPEKLSIIINSITQTDLSLTDSLLYVSELTKLLFPDGSCDNYYVLNHQTDFAPGEIAVTGIPELQIILAYQDPDEEETTYYLYSKETGLSQKNHDELQAAFDTQRYEYLVRFRKEIPNIIVQESKR